MAAIFVMGVLNLENVMVSLNYNFIMRLRKFLDECNREMNKNVNKL
jgi:hypothetical protein